ncbi:MAG TPA: MerR family transcriptional regulator [Rubrobacteraceae bacterium]|nr:MerR family transcriptional regulator [Rubrobacteraceae bacterium]
MNATRDSSRVGEVAERLGVSPRTIKYYEEIGLVEPEGRSQGGFRLYGEREVERLERILRMKGMGYSLAAIREILAVRDVAQEADKVTVLRTAIEHLKEREREATERIRQMGEDLRRAETLREELRRDIALCERRLLELSS